MAREINLLEQEISEYQSLAPAAVQSEPIRTDLLEHLHAAEKAQQHEKVMRQKGKRIIEALLFASRDPLPFEKIREIIDTFYAFKPRVLREIIEELQEEYVNQQHAFRLEEIAQGYLMRTCEEYSPFMELLYRNKRAEKLSQASAEVLAIIAYKQPVTRPQIESIRGVDCSGIIQNLLERQLIEPVGKLEVPGRPTLYGITKNFLKHFGLRDLKELPIVPSIN